MQNTALKIVINIVLTFATGIFLYGQEPDSTMLQPVTDSLPSIIINNVPDSINNEGDSVLHSSDTSRYLQDSLLMGVDSLRKDTVRRSGIGGAVTDEVDYDAIDSLVFSMDGGTVEMYNQAVITYGDIRLEAGYIKYEMQNSEVLAYGIPDSTGKITQHPIFAEGQDSYEAKYIRYNFKTQRGFIEEVITEQEGGFLHSRETKKQKNGHIHMKDGKYTTCDAEHPHFYVAITKGISMPGDKIVAGPAYIVVEDIPLPIGIPFGFFPNSRKQTSGILIPQYGEERNRGFYLRDGGYYFALNDYFDLRITGDVYSNGTWGVRAGSNYRWRYKFNGSVNVQLFNNVTGFKNVEELYETSKDYSINWSHAQAREANPNSNFRASVNLSSSSFDRQHTRNINQVVTNTKQSSISYTKNWPNSPFNLSASLNHSQNSNSGDVNMTLPKVSLNMGRINPFERKRRVGPAKWYEDIQLSYTSLLENRIRTKDTLLFTNQVWNDMNNGFRHEIPLSLNIKPFNRIAALQSFTITPNVSYRGMIYNGQTEKSIIGYNEEIVEGETIYKPIVLDTTYSNRLSYAHAYLPRVSAGMSPKIYGMYQFAGGGRLEAIRHVMTPSASFSYVPDMTAFQPDYYRDLYDTVNNVLLQTYSIYEDQMYGTPTFNGASGSVSLSLRNNLEAKIRSANDTIDEVKKVKLLDNFNLSTNYNIFNSDSLSPSWSPININGNTRLFNNKLSVSFRGVMDPFGYDDIRTRTTETVFSQTGKLARLTTASISMGTSFSSKGSGSDREEDGESDPLTESAFDNSGVNDPNTGYDPSRDDYYGDYVDFDVPWSLKLDYSFSYRKPRDVSSIVQTVRASGDLSLTPKWKIGFNTGYDIFNKQFTTTNLSLYRDLHCWEMRISVVPFGNYKSYNFQINAKSSILSDLKYNKRKSWQDNF
ncbi:MAG: putative LPS assembly protein LptD [Bacteroidales bacterium]